MKTATTGKKTKFIASLKNKTNSIEDAAKILNADEDIDVNHVSSMLGYLSGNTSHSIEALQSKYQSQGLTIEPDRTVTTK